MEGFVFCGILLFNFRLENRKLLRHVARSIMHIYAIR
jgi:hypothetical protein